MEKIKKIYSNIKKMGEDYGFSAYHNIITDIKDSIRELEMDEMEKNNFLSTIEKWCNQAKNIKVEHLQ